MFKRSRKKIILAIMGSLILLFAITLSVILQASYREIRQENMAMLKRHVELYYLDGETGGLPGLPPDGPPDLTNVPSLEPPGRPPLDQKPDYQLSTFYSVVFGESDTIIAVDNGEKEVYSEDELIGIAKEILAGNAFQFIHIQFFIQQYSQGLIPFVVLNIKQFVFFAFNKILQ